MSKKPNDPRQMPLNFSTVMMVDTKRAPCNHRFVLTSASGVHHTPARAHAGGSCATIVSFTDASTIALRKRAVQRVISAGIFRLPSTKMGPRD